ncbi:MFS transporter [Pseudomonas sp. CCM 7893]|uniref:MFS transporter n=1 Tax=Pseudomonas spelaei TaxID=1055469 RepID=A0A6I3WM41_9PSED|nr:MFS transporter [Pseudomonas spelaei]MUF08269.1 MFS transporter [Pseudomonas spelaei]
MRATLEVQAVSTRNRMWIVVFVFCFIGMIIDGADVMLLSYSLGGLKSDFGLTPFETGSLGSFTLAGMAVGGIYGGYASDRLGRVKTVVLSILLFTVGTGVLGFTQSYLQFSVVRFISALGMGSLYVACNTLMAEYVPTRFRNTVLGSLQAGWSVGYILATLMASWIIPTYGWRGMFFAGVTPVFLALLMYRWVPEPDTWKNLQIERATKKKAVSTGPKEKYKQIFSDPMAGRMFILWAITAAFLQFGNYGVNNWMPSYLEGELGMKFNLMTTFLVGSYSAMIVGKVIAGVAADRFGRRAIFVFGCLGTALFLPIIVLFNTPGNILWLLIIFGFLYGLPYSVNATYMTESFEAKFRGSAVGGAYNVGRIGAAVSPAAIGFFASSGSIGLGFLIVGGAYFLCGIIPALLIKEKQFDPSRE